MPFRSFNKMTILIIGFMAITSIAGFFIWKKSTHVSSPTVLSKIEIPLLPSLGAAQWQHESKAFDYITLDYSYLVQPLTYWLIVRSDGKAQYVQYKLGQGKVLAVKAGSLSSNQVDELFKLLEEKHFYDLEASYDGRSEGVVYEGDLMAISASLKGRQKRVGAKEPLAPPELKIIVDALQQIPASLQKDSSQTTFLRAEELSRSRATSLKKGGRFEFFSFSDDELKELLNLKAAIESPGFFISVTPLEKEQILTYLKDFPYFFVHVYTRNFQVRVFTYN